MAANLGFIMHAAQAHAGELAAHAVRNGMGDAGLADARRADKADDLALDLGVQLAHGQQFQDALFDFLQAVMLTVQYLAGVGLVEIILSRDVPGQPQAGIKIAADDAAFGGVGLHTGQAVTLFQQLFGGFLVEFEGQDFLTVGVGLGAGILRVTEFFADDVHLLAQVVFALAFVERGVDFIVKVALDLQHLAFLTQQHQQFFQAAQQRGFV